MVAGQQPEASLKHVDVEGALARVRGNKQLYRKMLGMFLDSEEVTALEHYLAAADYSRAAIAAHGIKGVAGNLSMLSLFEKITELMLQLQQEAPDPKTVKEYHEILNATRASVVDVIKVLDVEI